MSSISFRPWEIDYSDHLASTGGVFNGYFECVILPFLMGQQTIEFLCEKYELHLDKILELDRYREPPLVAASMKTSEGFLCLKIFGNFDTAKSVGDIFNDVEQYIKSISTCVDFPLICQEIRFFSLDHNKLIFLARRKKINRGMSFEVDERGIARHKVLNDLTLLSNCDERIQTGIKHYLTGLSLLSLEDMIVGLIDAAFMQFYLGCEVLCNTQKCEEAKKQIAKMGAPNSSILQLTAHHIWLIRHSFFGHGSVKNNSSYSSNFTNTFNIAKQVLVARWLCRNLIDNSIHSDHSLVREIRLYSRDNESAYFNGEETQFKKDFCQYMPWSNNKKPVSVYDENGKIINKIDIYQPS